MKYVWENYCKEAIEGPKQEWYIEAYSCFLKGEPLPEKPITPCTKWQHEQMFKKNEWCEKNCPNVVSDFAKWVEDEAKKPSGADLKAQSEAKKKSPVKNVDPQKYPTLGDEVTWNTPVPDKPDQATNWCNQWRHKVLFMQHQTCDCKYWADDLVLIAEKRKFKPLPLPVLDAPSEEIEITVEEVNNLLDMLVEVDTKTGEVVTPTNEPCQFPDRHKQPCVWVRCQYPTLFEPGIEATEISSAPADEEPATAPVVV